MPEEIKDAQAIIPIVFDDEPAHWAMVELNGELIAPTEFPTKEKARVILGNEKESLVELGTLQMTGENTPLMTLGSHQLKGKVEKLKEPFSIMRKNYDENEALKSYQVIGIVHERLIFNQYPKVIMR